MADRTKSTKSLKESLLYKSFKHLDTEAKLVLSFYKDRGQAKVYDKHYCFASYLLEGHDQPTLIQIELKADEINHEKKVAVISFPLLTNVQVLDPLGIRFYEYRLQTHRLEKDRFRKLSIQYLQRLAGVNSRGEDGYEVRQEQNLMSDKTSKLVGIAAGLLVAVSIAYVTKNLVGNREILRSEGTGTPQGEQNHGEALQESENHSIHSNEGGTTQSVNIRGDNITIKIGNIRGDITIDNHTESHQHAGEHNENHSHIHLPQNDNNSCSRSLDDHPHHNNLTHHEGFHHRHDSANSHDQLIHQDHKQNHHQGHEVISCHQQLSDEHDFNSRDLQDTDDSPVSHREPSDLCYQFPAAKIDILMWNDYNFIMAPLPWQISN